MKGLLNRVLKIGVNQKAKVSRLSKERKKIKKSIKNHAELKLINTALEKAKTVVLDNGTKIRISDNKSVFIINDDNTTSTPLPIGEYQMKDGKYLIIKTEGLVDDIIDKPAVPKEEWINKELGLSRKYKFKMI